MIDTILFDVDGVFTDGSFYYSENGKILKKFGPNDGDGIKFLLGIGLNVRAITADARGFEISQSRMSDIKVALQLVSETERFDYVSKNFDLGTLVFMGDGIHDAKVLANVRFGIAPANATSSAKREADYITPSSGGSGAVFEAAMHVGKIFFPEKYKRYLNERNLNEKDF